MSALIDTHCHLTHAAFARDADDTLARARAAGVEACITIGTGVEDARRARELAVLHPGRVFATAGLDPFSSHAAGDAFDEKFDELAALLRDGAYLAVGEIGLDYHYDLDPRPIQAERLERQLDLAARAGLPVVIHVREAHDDMAAILARHPGSRGVIHSFTGGPREAERYLGLGWHLGFGGVLTFKKAEAVREAARRAPRERLLVETDSPFLAPAPHRGRRCEPAYVAHTVEVLARLRDESADETAAITAANARALFRIVPAG